MDFYKKVKRLYHTNTLGLAIKGQIGDYLSQIGKVLNSEKIIYNSWTFAIFQRAALEIAPVVVKKILALFPDIKNVVDLGCGTGVYVAEFRKRNIDAEGFEYSEYARKMALELNKIKVHSFDLTKPFELKRNFDLAICIEVAEHLDPELGEKLVNVCCKYAKIVVFSAGQPGQKGQGHINLQPKSYWIEKFSKRGFSYDEEKSKDLEQFLRKNLVRGFWVANNVCIYSRKE